MPFGGQGQEVDEEKVAENEKKAFSRVTMEEKQKQGLKTGKALAREVQRSREPENLLGKNIRVERECQLWRHI